MKIIEAIIKPFMLDGVKDALNRIGIPGMTVAEVRGIGRQQGHVEVYRRDEYELSFFPKFRIEIAVSDGMAGIVVQAIRETAMTGRIGDGKIFVKNLEETVRVRTGECGDIAL